MEIALCFGQIAQKIFDMVPLLKQEILLKAPRRKLKLRRREPTIIVQFIADFMREDGKK